MFGIPTIWLAYMEATNCKNSVFSYLSHMHFCMLKILAQKCSELALKKQKGEWNLRKNVLNLVFPFA